MLWTAAVLAFIVYSIQAATLEDPPGDNVGIATRICNTDGNMIICS